MTATASTRPPQSPRCGPGQRGYTLVEVLITGAIVGIVSAMAVPVMTFARASARADSSLATLTAAVRLAREQAIGQRRNIQLTFTDPNIVTVERVEIPGPGTTVINTYTLDAGVTFQVFGGVPDTPDAFGNISATWFGGADTVAFTSEGSFVDENGDAVNGTLLIGRAGEPTSARALTFFGPTALVREWRWNGQTWVD